MSRSASLSPLLAAALLLCAAAVVPAPATASPFGINIHTPPESVIDEVAAAGIRWVRIDFMWSLVEAEPGVRRWELYDTLVDQLEARGLRVFATLQATPAWATAGPEFSGVPDEPARWQEFVYLAASRYRGRIDAWGMWNEANLPRFWAGSRSQYIDTILIPGARAVRAADPGALVVGPDLAHLSSADWDGWLRTVIVEAGKLLDVLAHHYYPGDASASDLLTALDSKPSWQPGSPAVRKILEDSGWWGRPFWLTETGVESGRVGWTPQADFYEQVVRDWFGPIPKARWMDRVFFYQIHDPPAPDTSTFGLLTAWPELDRKSAYYAYANAIAATEFVDGAVLEVDAPEFSEPGAIVEITVTLHNTGTVSWRGDQGFRLDVVSDRVAWRVLEHRLPTEFEVPPGAIARAVIPVQAPWVATPANATVAVRARLMAGDGRRFGDPIRAAMTASVHQPPQIRRHPGAKRSPEGGRVALLVEVESETPLSYRWRRNSVELDDDESVQGSRGPLLTVRRVEASIEGDYDCVVSNAAGPTVSVPARLEIGTPPPRRPNERTAPSPPARSVPVRNSTVIPELQ